jgi:hypothetical protein
MMRGLVLATALIFAAACGDPQVADFKGLWQLTSVNNQPLPATGNATLGEAWVASVLQITADLGLFDRCMQPPGTSTPVSRSTAILAAPIGDDRVTVSYFDRQASAPDTATLHGSQLILRYRNTVVGQEGIDVLTFVLLPGPLPEACTLAP